MGISVKEALEIGGLQKSRLIAGQTGLHNMIEHVSVLEIPEAYQWFRGNELFLTTFYNVQDDVCAQIQLLERMKAKNVAALGVCYPGMYYQSISPDVLQKADELHIPMIEVPNEVAYIEIISPILDAIEKKQSKEIHQALFIQNQLHDWLAMQLTLDQIISRMSEILQEDILILNENLEMIAYQAHTEASSLDLDKLSMLIASKKRELLTTGKKEPFQLSKEEEIVYSRPIRTGDGIYGFLIVVRQNENSFLQSLIYEYVSTSLALYFSQKKMIEETKERHQTSLLDDWFMGNQIAPEVFLQRASQLGWAVQQMKGIALVQPNTEYAQTDLCHSSIQAFLHKERNQSIGLRYGTNIVLLLDQRTHSSMKFVAYYQELLEKLHKHLEEKGLKQTVISFCGETSNVMNEGGKMYRELLDMVSFQRRISVLPTVLHAEKIPIFSFACAFQHHPLASKMKQLLEPLEKYDQQYQTDLVDTLELVLFCQDTQQLPSQINVHRNTLQYRRQRIKEILATDPFVNPYRVNFELALLLRKLQ